MILEEPKERDPMLVTGKPLMVSGTVTAPGGPWYWVMVMALLLVT